MPALPGTSLTGPIKDQNRIDFFCRSSAFSTAWTLRVCFSETWICGCQLSGSSTPAWSQKWWVPHLTHLYRHLWGKNSCPLFHLWLWSVSNIPTMSQISSFTLMIIFRPMETAPAMESLTAVSQIFLNTPCPSVSSWLWWQDIGCEMGLISMANWCHLKREDGNGYEADHQRVEHHRLVELQVPKRNIWILVVLVVITNIILIQGWCYQTESMTERWTERRRETRSLSRAPTVARPNKARAWDFKSIISSFDLHGPCRCQVQTRQRKTLTESKHDDHCHD